MINGMRVLAFVPARSGSKGIPNKNIKPLAGRPLIAYSIEAGLRSRYVDCTMVSTDSQAYADIAVDCGAWVPFLRPKSLATDTSKTIDAVLHALSHCESTQNRFDVFVLLQPTSPLRTASDVDAALEAFVRNGMRGLVSVHESDSNPVLIRTMNGEELVPLLNRSSTVRRQDMDEYYQVDGAIYVNLTDEIDENLSFNDNPIGFVMDKMHGVDIDEPLDFAIAEACMALLSANDDSGFRE